MKKFANLISVALIFGLIFSFATTNAQAFDNSRYVFLGGDTFGVKFYNDGAVVVELEGFFDGEKYVCPAKDGGIETSDIIKEINGQTIKTNEDVQAAVFASNGDELEMSIERNGKLITKEITPQKNTVGIYLLGAWVRDSCAGIGTVTYYDRDNNYFAALGHGICDSDTDLLLPLDAAEVVKANISSVTKSTVGKPGSLNGYFTDKEIGNLTKNTDVGVFGTINDKIEAFGSQIELGDFDDVKIGEAEIYTTVNGDEIGCYDIEITKIISKANDTNENFVIKITSEELIDKCGGIVQGMSGSPIIQDGKLVGAVTHVLVNKPCEGYGVMIQNMVDNSVE